MWIFFVPLNHFSHTITFLKSVYYSAYTYTLYNLGVRSSSDVSGRSSSPDHGHYICLLLESSMSDGCFNSSSESLPHKDATSLVLAFPFQLKQHPIPLIYDFLELLGLWFPGVAWSMISWSCLVYDFLELLGLWFLALLGLWFLALLGLWFPGVVWSMISRNCLVYDFLELLGLWFPGTAWSMISWSCLVYDFLELLGLWFPRTAWSMVFWSCLVCDFLELLGLWFPGVAWSTIPCVA